MSTTTDSNRTVDDLIFIGVGRRVIALDRYSGEKRWDWKCPKSAMFVSLLLDGDRLIVGVNGYIYCLEPLFGDLVWENPLKGMGVGVTSIATARGTTDAGAAAQAAAAAAAQAGTAGSDGAAAM